MGSVYRPRDEKTGKRRKVWMCSYTDEFGRRRRVSTGARSKEAAQQYLTDRQRDVDLARQGRPTYTSVRDAHIADLIARFVQSREDLGKTEGYINDLEFTLSEVVDLIHARRIEDITTASLTRGLFLFKTANIGTKDKPKTRKTTTRNKARGYFKHFFKWLMIHGPWHSNPALAVPRLDETDKKKRRALTEEEFEKLLSSVPRYRQIVYHFAARTGLRRNAIKTLLWEDVDLKAGTVTVRVLRQKNRVEKPKPLPKKLGRDLAAWFGERPGTPKANVFPTVPLVPTLHRDLKKIGIEPVTADGVFDFHALKVQFGTDLCRRNVHPGIAQELLDHSEIELTMRIYKKVDLADQRKALGVFDEPEDEDPNKGASPAILK